MSSYLAEKSFFVRAGLLLVLGLCLSLPACALRMPFTSPSSGLSADFREVVHSAMRGTTSSATLRSGIIARAHTQIATSGK